MLGRPGKAVTSSSDLSSDTFVGREDLGYVPDPLDYRFLSEEPKFQVRKHASDVEAMAERLAELPLWDGSQFSPDGADKLAKALCRMLRTPVRKKVLFTRSLYPRYASRVSDRSLAFDVAMLIEGNRGILEREQVIVHDYDFRSPVWVPVTVVKLEKDLKSRIPGRYMATIFADSGLLAGNTFPKAMSPKLVRFVLREVGFPRRKPSDVEDLTGVKMLVLFGKGERGLEMLEFSTSASQIENNKKLFRMRHGDRPCPFGSRVACLHCGTGTDRCLYAVYPNSVDRKEKEA